MLQAYVAGTAMSGLVASVLRMITKAALGSSHSGLRKGACEFTLLLLLLLVINLIYFKKWFSMGYIIEVSDLI